MDENRIPRCLKDKNVWKKPVERLKKRWEDEVNEDARMPLPHTNSVVEGDGDRQEWNGEDY